VISLIEKRKTPDRGPVAANPFHVRDCTSSPAGRTGRDGLYGSWHRGGPANSIRILFVPWI